MQWQAKHRPYCRFLKYLGFVTDYCKCHIASHYHSYEPQVPQPWQFGNQPTISIFAAKMLAKFNASEIEYHCKTICIGHNEHNNRVTRFERNWNTYLPPYLYSLTFNPRSSAESKKTPCWTCLHRTCPLQSTPYQNKCGTAIWTILPRHECHQTPIPFHLLLYDKFPPSAGLSFPKRVRFAVLGS